MQSPSTGRTAAFQGGANGTGTQAGSSLNDSAMVYNMKVKASETSPKSVLDMYMNQPTSDGSSATDYAARARQDPQNYNPSA